MMIGTARRTTRDRARLEMMAGGTILVSVNGRESFPVTDMTVTHTSTDPDAWVSLAATVDSYGDPAQRFYVLEPAAAVSLMTSTLERATLPDVPALEPDDGRRVNVKAWRHEIADWLRAHGIGASGPAWELATCGERDLTTLRRAAADAGTLVRHWSGNVMPAAVVAGDTLEGGASVVGTVTDPETGAVWVTVRTVKSATDHEVATLATTVTDVELAPDVPVLVTRGKGNIR